LNVEVLDGYFAALAVEEGVRRIVQRNWNVRYS